MVVGYADPPYPGQSAKHYADHADYAGEVDHAALVASLWADFDGWILHTSTPALADVLGMVEAGRPAGGEYRILSWVKPFAAFKRNVSLAYAWEPVIVSSARKPVVAGRVVMRDWFAESITLRRGLVGAKPAAVCRWLFEAVGADPGDDLVDLFPGSGAVGEAWAAWRDQLTLLAAP